MNEVHKKHDPGTSLLPEQQLPQPRRALPENSVTLGNYRSARDASLRASAGSDSPDQIVSKSKSSSSLGRNSSGESNETGNSDPKKWFDQSNKNPTATFDSNAMDVDPPFFQKDTDSSNEERTYAKRHHHNAKRSTTQSSSADEYRSVIDDLTVEIQKLKDELRRYKQNGPDMLRKDKLFEIKMHGLPKRKKRELETTLRDFASSLENTPDTSLRHGKQSSSSRQSRTHVHSATRSISKNAPSSSGSNARPVDSAYASMSVGAQSSRPSLGRPTSTARSSSQKVESYLRDIPAALYPRHISMTDKEKQKLVVRRLEQLFTGKLNGVYIKRDKDRANTTLSGGSGPRVLTPTPRSGSVPVAPPALETQQSSHRIGPSGLNEACREARILPPDQQSGSDKKSRSQDNGVSSRSAEDQTESAGNGNSSGGAPQQSPTMPPPPEQRVTRLKDLDPDRAQVPSENIEYIKHLGLVPPELLVEPAPDVHPDADGWVYLNLLCNLAQLHIINVTSDFVRAAVSDISTKFQLSPDGRKIRWRGGTEGTRFSSDNLSEDTLNSMDNDSDGSPKEVWRKRQKTGHSTGDDFNSRSSSKNQSNPTDFASSDGFHYKPLFIRQDSYNGQSSMDETLSSFGPVEESNIEDSRLGSATSAKRKRRYDGAIIYYSGAPFCTDLSGDPNDASPSNTSNLSPPGQFVRPIARRTGSGSYFTYRPLSDSKLSFPDLPMDDGIISDENLPSLTADNSDEGSDIDFDHKWSDAQQFLKVHSLEPCGLGGVLPEDHFMVVVTTKRALDVERSNRVLGAGSKDAEGVEITDSIVSRLASMSTSTEGPVASLVSKTRSPMVEIEYISGRIKRLAPVRLPPPVIFLPPFSSDSSSDYDELSDDPVEESTSGVVPRQRLHPVHSDDYPDGVDLTSGDEDGEDPDDEPGVKNMYDAEDGNRSSRSKRLPYYPRRTSSDVVARNSGGGHGKMDSIEMASGSSVATAGGHGSNQDGSMDMSS